MIGKTFSHYKILEKLGGGGMGVVYQARDLKLDRFVAIKFLPPHLGQSQDEKKRFVHEAKAASALEHNNICNIHEIDETEDGQMFIVMAYYEGETLKKRIESGLLPIDNAVEIAIQVAEGLSRAHEENIVHRDVKPANLMITTRGDVKIVDFGLAKLAGRTVLTKEGMTVGTVAYMSPEQAQGMEVDHRTDIWALGTVLYEMISGQQPFKGDYEQAVVYSILNESPEPLTGLRTAVPMELERFVNKSIAKSPDERYQHVTDMLVDLRNVNKNSKLQATRLTTVKSFRSRNILSGTIAGLLLTILISLFLFHSWFSKSDTIDPKSIAVLPFENLNKTDDNYFSDGITEDILTQISKIADLRVLSRFTIKNYDINGKSSQEIGRELNVSHLLTGSLRHSGNQLRIACQLIDVSSEAQIWAETYDREMKDLFTIQSQVAFQIATMLKAHLSPAEKKRISKPPTPNLSAYDQYLQGRDSYYRYTSQDNENAIKQFKKAITWDRNYALALAGLGDAYAQKAGRYGFDKIWLDSALVVSKKALLLDPSSAEAHKALGLAYYFKGQNEKSMNAYLEAVEFNPNYASAVGNISY